MSPRIDFEPQNKNTKVGNNYDYPKLKLKHGERARIVLLESPVMNYQHTLRKPQVINGVPQMVTEKRKDGSEYQDYKKDFISTPLCLGDYDTLETSGSDPDKCPACKMAMEHPDWVQAPKARYAMHVIRYKTKSGSFELTTPFSVEVLVWAFSPKVFNQIIDIRSEWGDLRKHDLLLGPCENESFQKFEINVGAKGEWTEDDQRKALTIETFKENQIPDLDIATGSKKEERWLREDLNQIAQSWALVAGASAVNAEDLSKTSLSDDLSSLLDEPTDAAPVNGADETLDALATAEEKTAKAEKKPAEEKPADNFDDLLANL